MDTFQTKILLQAVLEDSKIDVKIPPTLVKTLLQEAASFSQRVRVVHVLSKYEHVVSNTESVQLLKSVFKYYKSGG